MIQTNQLLSGRTLRDRFIKHFNVDRYLSDIKAVFAYAALEQDIPYTNPFRD